jgi:nucleotide-binding universal stress UspA family protein
MTSNIVARPIVVGVDGSASSMYAARWAAGEASRRRRPLRLVHAVNASPLAYTSGLGSPESFAEFFEALESDGRRHLIDAETAVRGAHPDLEIDTELQSADPVPTLITESGQAWMIVLGSRGLGGFTGILAGSTAVALAGHGHCPVAVLRGRTPGQEPPAEGPALRPATPH